VSAAATDIADARCSEGVEALVEASSALEIARHDVARLVRRDRVTYNEKRLHEQDRADEALRVLNRRLARRAIAYDLGMARSACDFASASRTRSRSSSGAADRGPTGPAYHQVSTQFQPFDEDSADSGR
jgi:hypothetical protein